MRIFDGVEDKKDTDDKNLSFIKSQEYNCPKCQTDNTEKHKYYRRCNNDNCKVVTYFSPDYTIAMKETTIDD